MLTHIVLLRLTDSNDAPEAVSRLESLVGQVPSLLSLSAGTNVRDTPASYDVGLTTTHADLAGLTEYIEHEAHKAVTAWLSPRVSARAMVDHL